MNFKLLVITPRSISIELENSDIYYTNKPYSVYVNGLLVKNNMNKNVFSVFKLLPDTNYEIEIIELESGISVKEHIRTKKEFLRLNVKDFGAKGDGQSLDSIYIQAAISACPKNGTVYIPKGTYYCTPLFLKSNMTIEFEEHAVLKGHIDRSLYPILPGVTSSSNEKSEYYLGTWEGNPLSAYASLITGIDVEHVSIIGKGIIDGNAQHSKWWDNPKIKTGAWRPRTLFLKGCNDILVQGLTVQNSPSWTVHPYLSSKLSFVDLSIQNPEDSPNTDGLDPESCEDVNIIGVDFSVGDDCIAIKSGKLYMGQKIKKPSQRLVIRNCRMRHGHGAVVIGSEMSGGVNDVHVSQCIFEETDRGLRIKTRRGRGQQGIIDNISFDNINMNDVLTPFVINMFYFCDPDGKSEYVWSKEKLAKDEFTPYLGKFQFKDIKCIGCEVATGFFSGLPEQPIEEIRLHNVFVQFKKESTEGYPAMMSFLEPMSKKGIIAEYVNKLSISKVTIEKLVGEELMLSNVQELQFDKEDRL